MPKLWPQCVRLQAFYLLDQHLFLASCNTCQSLPLTYLPCTQIKTSSIKSLTSHNPSKICAITLCNTLGSELLPNGLCLNSLYPNGVLKITSLEPKLTFFLQKWLCYTNSLEYFYFSTKILAVLSLVILIRYYTDFMASFWLCESIHIHNIFDFSVTTT